LLSKKERDIDDKVQFWVDCIQSSAPGAAILPVASYSDYFDEGMGGQAEAIRRCNILKQRLLKHEERRRLGMEERLQEYRAQNPPNESAAARLQKLLCTYTRPKLIFGDDDQNSVVRVSGKKYFGFELLTEKIINIATGRDKAEYTYPIFHGHVGARIPRMRLQVRDAVREMRDRFKVVEWGYFVNRLRDQGLLAVEDISDALHFLTNTGELSYFGPVMQSPPDNPVNNNRDGTIDEEHAVSCTAQLPVPEDAVNDDEHKGEQSEDDDNDDDVARLSLDDTSITAPSTADGSLTTVDDFMSTGLSHFVFLNPRWLVAAVACILRHDLDREIKETRRTVSIGGDRLLSRTASFFDAQLNCPVITADDAQLLWGANRITKKAAERAERFSNDLTMTPFEFLQRLLIRFGVFVPIDLTIEKATFGGKDYQLVAGTEIEVQDNLEPATPGEIMLYNASKTSNEQDSLKAEHFFLPSLLGPWDHTDAWTYKNTDSWKTTLCHSVLFPDGVPPGLMERLTASVLSSIYAVVNQQDTSTSDVSRTNLNSAATCEGRMSLKQVLCWRTAFYLKIGSQVPSGNGIQSESQVEIFVQLADRDAPLCVGSDYMEVGARRLIVSGRGQEGDGGRKIWKGGYLLVIKCVTRVMQAYGGLEYEMQGFCPECLAKVPVSQASSWELTKIRHAVLNLDRTLRCKHFGHPVDTRFLAGPLKRVPEMDGTTELAHNESSTVAVRDLQHAVVVVGLWDGREKKVTRVGSGFLCDRKRGLIVTAAHTLINIWGDPKYQYGENYYGLSQGKVVIGVIPEVEDNQGAVFRYFAKIVSRCNFLDGGSCRVDACVLRITTRMETDVAGDGSGCGDVPEILLLNNPRALKNERLQNLKMTSKCELNENVRILGYNQGGEGMVRPGEVLNRFIDLSRGYVSKKFVHDHNNNGKDDGIKKRDRFQPREEIVVSDCRTIGGHSGGPCVNQQGEVIGILSRADVADHQRCYLVPTSELEVLVRQAKKQM
jgi:S1-C subfamily serine protease